MPKIAFLALDDIHHLPHIAPVAFELSQYAGYQCVIYLQAPSLALINKIAAQYPTHRCKIEILTPSFWRRMIMYFRRGICSPRRIIRHHAERLLAFDAIVTPDINVDELIRRAKSRAKRPLFFISSHGGGDRARAYHLLKDYDFVLLCGEKRRRIFCQEGYITAQNSLITGYPKFDIIPAEFHPKVFANNLPVVLYNPHSNLALSSWQPWGLAILEYFYHSKTHNLIFAPHCNLFRRQLAANIIPPKYFSAPNILIDLGSEKSVDMTYTQAADIYLGDVSSQVYEFIRQPRPCLFLNAHKVTWQNNENYACWNFGVVISDLKQLPSLLTQTPLPNPHTQLQQQYFADTFSITSVSAAARSAAAIYAKISSKNLPLMM